MLKNKQDRILSGAGLRKGLVVFQFTMSIVLIVGTVTIYQQLGYIRDKNLGVDRENVLYVTFEGGVREQYETFKQDLLQESGVMGVALASQNPLSIGQNTADPTWDGKDPGDNAVYSIISTDHDFIETMKIEMKEGRTFSKSFSTDSSNYIVNETAARKMGMDKPIGKRLTLWDREGIIVGVVKDFHTTSLYNPIQPVIMRLSPGGASIMFVRLRAGREAEAVNAIERNYKAFNPEYPLNYRFMDDEFEETYRSETVIATLSNYFAILTILIACFGLFGLAAFMAEQRRKEIGIRKVLGASASSVVFLFSKEFVLLVAWAFMIAAPISFFLMTEWLNGFAYHTDFGVLTLLGAGIISVLIAWLTVSFQSIRAATVNPVVAIRSE